MTREANSLGTVQTYNERETDVGVPNSASTYGYERQIALTFTADQLDLPTLNAAVDAAVLTMPANAYIVSSVLEVVTTFVGGTDITIGLEQPDGTIVDADGLHAAILTAALVAGAWDTGAGALVGEGVGATDVQVSVTQNGTYTAGEARLILKYYLPSTGQ